MSGNQPIAQVTDPDLRSLLLAFKQEIMGTLNCHQVGQIVSFDSGKQTATVKLAINKQVVDYTQNPPQWIYLPYPLLTDCPVFIPSGGTGRLTFPVAAGDPCLVLFNDRDLDNWFSGGSNTPPNSNRTHDLSDGMVLVGVRNLATKLTAYNTSQAELAFAGGKLKVGDKVALDGNASTLKIVLNTLITALTALDAKTGPSAATQIALAQTQINNLML